MFLIQKLLITDNVNLLRQNLAIASTRATPAAVEGCTLFDPRKGTDKTTASVLDPRGARKMPYTF